MQDPAFNNPNHENMSILWAGGWDEYKVDITDQIDDPGDGGTEPLIYLKGAVNCTSPNYVRTKFSAEMDKRFPGKALRNLGHINGGD